MPSIESADRKSLLEIADESLHYGLLHQCALPVQPEHFSPSVQEKRASFVTLHLDHKLRGCIGTLEAYRLLVEDVAENAYAAGFLDPRFAPLTPDEIDFLSIGISVLSSPEAVVFESESDLLETMQPGIDGLILQEGNRRGTFLPSVWKSLPEAGEFLRQLKLKAGLGKDYWSATIQVYRYTTESFSA